MFSKIFLIPRETEISRSKESLEDTRLKYRYLDLRNESVHNNILFRSKVIDFISKYISYDKLVILDKDKLEYYNDSTFLYVDLNEHEVYVNGDDVTVKYLSIDSDRHSDKEKLILKLDKNNGIFVYNNKYLLFIHNKLFYKYQIKNV